MEYFLSHSKTPSYTIGLEHYELKAVFSLSVFEITDFFSFSVNSRDGSSNHIHSTARAHL